jgi:oligoribonuclease NrnB/cAMP/cGMP phosphodiesterase (DHH superfamily)
LWGTHETMEAKTWLKLLKEIQELLSELARNNSMIEDYSKRVEYETNRKIEETYRNWIRHYVNENVHLISLIEIKKAQMKRKR